MAKRSPKNSAPLGADADLCVAFVNTTGGGRRALETYDDLLAWGVGAGTLGAAESPRLERAAAEHPGPAASVVRRSRTLGARLKRLLLAFGSGRKPEGSDFLVLNTELRAVLDARQLVITPSGCQWSWDKRDEDLDRMLWPVLQSAADLLASGEVSKVRQCPAEGCGLLFVAKGGGRPRKWCSPACGNRATSKKHYHEVRKPERQRRKQDLRDLEAARLARPWRRPAASSDDD